MLKQRLIFLCAGVVVLLAVTKAAPALPVDVQVEFPPEKLVALTFDDGPRRATTQRLLDGLQARGARATFFLIGQQVEPAEDLVVRMREEGHQVGNHTWQHVRLQGADTEKLMEEIIRTDLLLRRVLGEGTYWLRPPYGFVDKTVRERVEVPLAKWNVDPQDWKLRNREQVVREVLAHVQPGAIVLLHDIYDSSVDAALDIVDVEELMAANGIHPGPGDIYRSGAG